MKPSKNQLIYSPTDLSNFINCKHLSELDKREATGEIEAPEKHHNPVLKALMEKGILFEQEHLTKLSEQGLNIIEIDYEDPKAEQRTIEAMKKGADVIYQARLKTDRWSGWADFMIKVEKESELGSWSYEVWDTKLASSTKASTILQIGLYSQGIAEIQGVEPEYMGVIKPNGKEIFRYHDYAAYIRLIQQRLEVSLETDSETYPEPVSHCDICRWWKNCNAQRRQDDHLSFVAGMGKSQIVELKQYSIKTLKELAEESNPVSFDPVKGSKHTYNRLRDQANLQFQSRTKDFEPIHQILPLEEGRGFYLLPEPSEHDIYLDLEGARMVEPDGLEYLIGYYYKGKYTGLWATNEVEELKNFETFVDWAHDMKQQHPELYIYHYAPYETTAFKRLMGKYASRENKVDDLLRSRAFVDLYRVLRQSLIASVERYSLKDLEVFFGYERVMDLRKVSAPKTSFEYLLEIKKPENADQQDLTVIEEYNNDDCKALIELQIWLEKLRAGELENAGDIPRPEQRGGDASETITEHQERISPLFTELLKEVPVSEDERSETEQAQFILAHFLDWYRREDKALWWEYFRLQELEPDKLLEERKAVAYLKYTGESYQEKKSRVDVYTFPPQEVDLKEGALKNQSGESVGTLQSINKEKGLLEIKKGPSLLDLDHPASLIQLINVRHVEKEESIIRLAQGAVDNGLHSDDPSNLVARKLLLRQSPMLPQRKTDQNSIDFALEALSIMNGDYLAIQGPPGAGKSYTGSHLILDLVKKKKKVGITAMSHKVITNLLVKTYDLAKEKGEDIRIIQKGGTDAAAVPWELAKTNPQIVSALENFQVIAGTSFMWARPEFHESVDYLFVDEAGQLALIDTVALAQAAKNLVLLGDPNQLQQPQQGVHPAGTQVSALEHILNGNLTITEDQGIFLETTWRMHPKINEIVSELFYQNRLKPENHLVNQGILNNNPYQAGLVLLEANHEGNTSSSIEEVGIINNLIRELTKGDLKYLDEKGHENSITPGDIKVISPYNAQVKLLQESLGEIAIGTVDKFQGQEAPIVIYSVASSSPTDAPRGMDFLYSPNRLNVAISRAKVLFIMVSSPAIFEAQCKSPKEMKLANAFCRYREMAQS